VYTWGANTQGQLGLGATAATEQAHMRPVRALCVKDGYDRAAETACGKDFTFALDVKGRLLGWGSGESGKLGLGDRIDRAVPSAVQGIPAGCLFNAYLMLF